MAATVEVRPTLPYKESRFARHKDYRHPKERIDFAPDIETALVHRFEAERTLNELALAIPHLDRPKDGEYYLDVAGAQVEMGVDYSDTLSKAVEIVKDNISGQTCGMTTASQIAALGGDDEKAYVYAQSAARWRDAWPLSYTADIVREQGRDAGRFLDRAAEIALGARRYGFHGLEAIDYAELAAVMARHGRDGQEWLNRARTTLENSGVEHAYAYSNLALKYASLGDFKTAREMVRRIDHKEPVKAGQERIKTFAGIAHLHFDQGNVADAVNYARLSENPLTISSILMKKAATEVKSGIDPQESVVKALDVLTNRLEDNLGIDREKELTIAHARAGRIQAAAGNDYQKYFDDAMYYAENAKYPGHTIEAYKYVARDKFAAGHEVYSILGRALDLDALDSTPGDLHEIYRAALYCGYFDYAEFLLKRLDGYRDRYPKRGYAYEHCGDMVDGWLPTFMLDKARAFAQNGLTKDQLSNLSKADLAVLHVSNNLKVRQAITHFNLAA